jgi:hypothetical protein
LFSRRLLAGTEPELGWGELMRVFVGDDWAEDVRHEVTWCE